MLKELLPSLPSYHMLKIKYNSHYLFYMNQEGSIDILAELPHNIIVHDMSFDWTGRRLAAVCSDKTIRTFTKKAEKWIKEEPLVITGAAAWKVKWTRPEFGAIIATCSLDTEIRIYQLKKVDKGEGEKFQWFAIHNIKENKPIQDIKFIPIKFYGLCIAIVTSDGWLKVLKAQDSRKLKDWVSYTPLLVSELGLSCLSWSKNFIKDDQAILAIGCKNLQSSPKKVLNGMKIYSNMAEEQQQKIENISTIAFVNFNGNFTKPLQKINVPKIKQVKAINDISWALMNGRSYYLLAVASDTFIKESQKESAPSIDVLRELTLSNQTCLRLSWNVMGTYLSGSQKKKIRIWRCLSRGIWNQIKEIQS